MSKLTPLHIELLIHYHVSAGPWPRPSVASKQYTRHLLDWNLIRADMGVGYRSTEGGAMLLDAMCALPVPRQTVQWTMDPAPGDPAASVIAASAFDMRKVAGAVVTHLGVIIGLCDESGPCGCLVDVDDTAEQKRARLSICPHFKPRT